MDDRLPGQAVEDHHVHDADGNMVHLANRAWTQHCCCTPALVLRTSQHTPVVVRHGFEAPVLYAPTILLALFLQSEIARHTGRRPGAVQLFCTPEKQASSLFRPGICTHMTSDSHGILLCHGKVKCARRFTFLTFSCYSGCARPTCFSKPCPRPWGEKGQRQGFGGELRVGEYRQYKICDIQH